jgi:hypothetical protein
VRRAAVDPRPAVPASSLPLGLLARTASIVRMPGYQYTTVVMTHGFMGRKSDELDRSEFERSLNEMGAQGWELEKVLLDMNLHREKDGHVLIFKRPAA